MNKKRKWLWPGQHGCVGSKGPMMSPPLAHATSSSHPRISQDVRLGGSEGLPAKVSIEQGQWRIAGVRESSRGRK